MRSDVSLVIPAFAGMTSKNYGELDATRTLVTFQSSAHALPRQPSTNNGGPRGCALNHGSAGTPCGIVRKKNGGCCKLGKTRATPNPTTGVCENSTQ
jgi:hypothetical protein